MITPSRTGDAAELSASLGFTRSTRDVAAARRFVTSTLRGWRCDGLVQDAQLVASELVTNAIVHAGSGGVLHLHLRPGLLRMAVSDHGDGTPHVLPPSDSRRGGRGLAIVADLAHDWGIDPRGSGKTIWAHLRA